MRTAAALKHLIQLRIEALADVQDEGDQVFARQNMPPRSG